MYRFTPPTSTFHTGTHPLWRKVANPQSSAVVVYDDGRISTVQDAPAVGDDGAARVWPGGRTYELTDDEATTLIEAGYGSYIEVVA